ncbi:MAG: hypothetical protein METHP_01854 [Methanoregula sp. SKADARSKE-2]|nr:MAG: hypothetical protein METHP_01854 [Methanoregula sp. SKADARSKE-2]
MQGKSHNIHRLVLGWIILIILPVTQFAIPFTLLGYSMSRSMRQLWVCYGLSSSASVHSFRSAISGFMKRSFTVPPDIFFADDEQKGRSFEIRPDFPAHFIPGILYVFIPTILLVVALSL